MEKGNVLRKQKQEFDASQTEELRLNSLETICRAKVTTVKECSGE